MAAERFVVLGLARPRSSWFRSVAQWSTGAALPAEFLKCVSADELRARLASGRPASAVLLDGGLPAADRELMAAAREAGCAVLVVDDVGRAADWAALGAAAVLPSAFGRDELLDALTGHAPTVGPAMPTGAADHPVELGGVVGGLVAVCGPGGTGASTVAAALAQGLATDGAGGEVLLADLCLRADQAMLHDVRDVAPGVQELVEAHRLGRPSREELRALTFVVVDRRYRLLLGLRRARYWTALRPRAWEAALDSLRRTFAVVVADVSGDLEGEDATGSADVEERNLLARSVALAADVVFVVGRPGAKGVHGLVRLLGEALDAGIDPARLQPVLNQAPRSPRARAELTRTVTDLVGPAAGAALPSPVFLPRRPVEAALRDGVALPRPLPGVLAGAFRAATARLGPAGPRPAELVPVTPGSLGALTVPEAG